MKKLTVIGLALIGLSSGAAAMEGLKAPSEQSALVCFIDFRVGLAIGRNEEEIGSKGPCRYTIDKKVFRSMLLPRKDSEFYQKSNVRAKIIYSPTEVYFIDANGVVRFGDHKFVVNKDEFTKYVKDIHGK